MSGGRHPILPIVVGGMIGALLRALMVETFPVHPGTWPWATFAVNIVGCLVLGVVVTRHHHYDAAPHWHPLLGTGVAGALTTFSTLQVELLNLLDDGDTLLAVSYAAASIALGLAAIAAATWAVHHRNRVAP
jgi:fluoride exporter